MYNEDQKVQVAHIPATLAGWKEAKECLMLGEPCGDPGD